MLFRSPEEPAERLRHDRIHRRQAGAATAASRTDGTESERCPQPGGRHGRNAHGSSSAGAGPVAAHAGEHERDRVGLLHRGDGLPQRKTMAWRRSHRALGRLWFAGGRAPVPQGAGLPGDSVAFDCAGERGFEESCCRGSEGCVVYDGRELLTFNGIPGNVQDQLPDESANIYRINASPGAVDTILLISLRRISTTNLLSRLPFHQCIRFGFSKIYEVRSTPYPLFFTCANTSSAWPSGRRGDRG